MERIKAATDRECKLIVCGASRFRDQLVDTLRHASNSNTLVQILEGVDSSLRISPNVRTSRKPKLAIVGMAGRFPDAADHEKFWNLLEAGADLHKRVCEPLTTLLERLILKLSILLDT